MPAADSQKHWATIAEVGSAKGMLILFWIYKLLGRLPFRLVLMPVVLYYFLFNPRQRAASREYLSRCRPRGEAERPAGIGSSVRHFASFGEALLDKFVAWNGGFGFEDVTFEGYDAVKAVFERGQGMLLLGSHLGNLEVCRVLSQLRPGLRLRVLVHTRHATTFNRLLERLNPNSQVSLQQVTELGVAEAAELSAWVAGGGVVLIAADRVPVAQPELQPRVTFAPFLGHRAPFPQGPFILGSLLGCPAFLLFCLRRGRRFEAIFEPFAEPLQLPRRGRDDALAAYAARYAARLEERCRSAPFQWFNFFPFWSQHEITRSG